MVIRAEQLAQILGCDSARAARRIARQPGFPAAVELSPGRRGWIRDEVIGWIESRKIHRDLPTNLADATIDERLTQTDRRGQRRGPRKAAA